MKLTTEERVILDGVVKDAPLSELLTWAMWGIFRKRKGDILIKNILRGMHWHAAFKIAKKS